MGLQHFWCIATLYIACELCALVSESERRLADQFKMNLRLIAYKNNSVRSVDDLVNNADLREYFGRSSSRETPLRMGCYGCGN